MENSKKEKVIKILKRVGIGISLAFNFLFALALIIGSANVNKGKTQCALAENDIQEKVEFKQDNRKFVSYNDESYSITLTADELNNYIFENFYDYLDDLYHSASALTIEDLLISLTCDDISYAYDYGNGASFVYAGGDNQIAFNHNPDTGSDTNDYKFLFLNGVSGNLELFANNLIFVVNEGDYDEFKQAIELDIQANSGNINDGVFETLTKSTVGFIGVLGSGIVNMTSIFYDTANSQLTTIGLLSVIVVAVSLAYFLFRLLIGLIRMRG